MRTRQWLCVLGLGLMLAPAFFSAVFAAEADKTPAGGDLSAGRLVQSALKAETLGDNASREVLLRGAIERDAEYAPARWHAGQVRVGDRWLPLEEAESAAAASPELAEYRRLRQEKTGTPEGELALARWCDEHGLADRASVHWMNVLRFDPQHAEALRKLDLRWYRGQLMTPEEIEQAQHAPPDVQRRAEAQATADTGRAFQDRRADSLEQWRRTVNGWVRALERNEPEAEAAVRQTVLAITEADDLYALGETVRQRCVREAKSDVLQRLSLAVLRAAQEHPTLSPLPVLMVYAVDHPSVEVRAAAADGLKKFPRDQYVPVLIGQMDTPIEGHWVVAATPFGSYASVFAKVSYYKRGPEADYSVSETESLGLTYDSEENAMSLGPSTQRFYVSLAAARGQATAAATEARNAVVLQRNARIREALRLASGVDQGEDPVAWYNWWTDCVYDYYENERPDRSDRPVYETYTYSTRSIHTSCFPPGTKVWTETGAVDIETIIPGDRVLSQNPLTGELSLQEVLETTRRNPSAMIRIGLGEEEILATRSHPFWVLGEGWRMAKQLQPGMRLHGVRGAVTVDRVEEVPLTDPAAPPVCNLVVNGFGTYFVGQDRLLVHDFRLFQHTTLAVPGLEEE